MQFSPEKMRVKCNKKSSVISYVLILSGLLFVASWSFVWSLTNIISAVQEQCLHAIAGVLFIILPDAFYYQIPLNLRVGKSIIFHRKK